MMRGAIEGVPHAVFASRSGRELPWDGPRHVDTRNPGPGEYAASDEFFSSRGSRSGAASAFSSSSDRFKTAASCGPSYSQVGVDDEASASVQGVRPSSPSASFASRSQRFSQSRAQSPGAGTYSPRSRSAVNDDVHYKRCASIASTSQRLLPFEEALISRQSQKPDSTYYSPPRDGVIASPRRSSSGASLQYTSQRFVEQRTNTPGPGEYEMRLGSTGHGCRGLPSSTADYSLQFASQDTPGAGSYNPHEPNKPTLRRSASFSGRSGRATGAAFVSSSQRFGSKPSSNPGPGSYCCDDMNTISTRSGVASPRRSDIRRSSSFSSSQARFSQRKSTTPGPGSYVDEARQNNKGRVNTGTPLRALPASAAFASRVARTELPHESGRADDTPGPGAHEWVSPMASAGVNRQNRGSPAFRSSSPRFKEVRSEAPSPGAYHPQQAHFSTQKYSVRRQ